ncbi:MAG: phage holin family protein [Mucilaginibacter sp.]
MNHLTRLLKTFDYHNAASFLQSLMPSTRYGVTFLFLSFSVVFPAIDKIFGLDGAAFIAMGLVFMAELLTGVVSAIKRKEPLSSVKLSRFVLKMACYMILISSTYLMSVSFKNHNKDIPAWVFDWLHVFLIAHIVLENIVSILENLAQINGKEKPAYLNKIQEKFNSLI